LLRENKQQPNANNEIENFLYFKPRRLDFEWYINDDGLVRIKVPKFRSKFGKSFCKIIRKEDNFIANLDAIGSSVWKQCDGRKNIKQIFETLKKEFPNEENIEQRLIYFISQMNALDYIDY